MFLCEKFIFIQRQIKRIAATWVVTPTASTETTPIPMATIILQIVVHGRHPLSSQRVMDITSMISARPTKPANAMSI